MYHLIGLHPTGRKHLGKGSQGGRRGDLLGGGTVASEHSRLILVPPGLDGMVNEQRDLSSSDTGDDEAASCPRVTPLLKVSFGSGGPDELNVMAVQGDTGVLGHRGERGDARHDVDIDVGLGQSSCLRGNVSVEEGVSAHQTHDVQAAPGGIDELSGEIRFGLLVGLLRTDPGGDDTHLVVQGEDVGLHQIAMCRAGEHDDLRSVDGPHCCDGQQGRVSRTSSDELDARLRRGRRTTFRPGRRVGHRGRLAHVMSLRRPLVKD